MDLGPAPRGALLPQNSDGSSPGEAQQHQKCSHQGRAKLNIDSYGYTIINLLLHFHGSRPSQLFISQLLLIPVRNTAMGKKAFHFSGNLSFKVGSAKNGGEP